MSLEQVLEKEDRDAGHTEDGETGGAIKRHIKEKAMTITVVAFLFVYGFNTCSCSTMEKLYNSRRK